MLIDVLNTMLGAFAFLILALSIELVAPLGKVSLASRMLGLQLSLAKAVGVGLIVPPMTAAWASLGIRPLDLGPIFGTGIPGAVAGALSAILALDFLSYWHHRFLHRFFWPVHATHHAIRELSAFNGYAHFAEKITEFMLIAIPLSLVRWETPVIPAAITLTTNLLQHWIHSPTTAQMNMLRALIVTPRFHRIHHSLEPRHFDRNFGILFSFWDRLFGTACEPGEDEWPDTGIADHDEARSILTYVVHPLIYLMGRSSFRRDPSSESPNQ